MVPSKIKTDVKIQYIFLYCVLSISFDLTLDLKMDTRVETKIPANKKLKNMLAREKAVNIEQANIKIKEYNGTLY